jgi:hypothetical protein
MKEIDVNFVSGNREFKKESLQARPRRCTCSEHLISVHGIEIVKYNVKGKVVTVLN